MTEETSYKKKEIMKSFFEYWDHLPNFKTIDEDQVELINQEIRNAIIDILAIGIPDIDPMTDKQRKRHVLNARELLELINQRLEGDIKKSNLYFHLQKLEENELIREVDRIPRGKQFTSYYGRVAKGYLSADLKQDLKFSNLIESGQLTDFITEIQEAKSEIKMVDHLLKSTFQSFNERIDEKKLGSWLEKYQSILLEMEIDVREIFDLFWLLSRFDIKTFENMRKIADLLDANEVYDNPE